MITIAELAQELGTTTELGIEVPVNARHIIEFDQTLPADADGDTELTEADAQAIREAWTA